MVDRVAQRRVKSARLALKVFRVFMPLFIIVCSWAAVAGRLSGGLGALAAAYLVMVMMFQMARWGGGLPVRMRNLVLQPWWPSLDALASPSRDIRYPARSLGLRRD